MKVEIKVPSPGESITEVQIAAWLVENGEYVERDQDIVEVDSDKATLSIPATESGQLEIKVEEGETIEVGTTIAVVDTSVKGKPKVEKVIEKVNEQSALVVVPDYQLSLAIGKEGQNARLAAKLTGWKIDIKSVTQYNESLESGETFEESVIEEEAVVEEADVNIEELSNEENEV